MGKLHELLAVENSITANYNAITDETLKVLGKPEMFTRQTVTKTFFDEADARLNTSKSTEMGTTVPDRLKWWGDSVVQFLDVQFQKDCTNRTARADLVVGGTTIAKDVPATTLLMLENKLQDLRKVIMAAPTLPVGRRWEKSKEERHVWRDAEDETSFSTKKTAKAVVLYEATKEHPAQVKEVFEDVPVAKNTTVTYRSMLTSLQKADMLGRLDALLRAAKTARQRANSVNVVDGTIGEAIVDYVLGDVVTP